MRARYALSTPPLYATTTEPSDASVSPSACSFRLLVPASAALLVIVLFFVIVVGVLVVFEVVVIIIVVVFVIVRREIELDRRQAGHFQVRAAVRAAQLIALVDIEFVDLDLGIAFGAGGHTVSDHLESCPMAGRSRV